MLTSLKKWCKSFFVEDVKLPFYTATKWLYDVVVLSSPAFFHGIAILQNNVLQNAMVHVKEKNYVLKANGIYKIEHSTLLELFF